jgi:hypothetical protein
MVRHTTERQSMSERLATIERQSMSERLAGIERGATIERQAMTERRTTRLPTRLRRMTTIESGIWMRRRRRFRPIRERWRASAIRWDRARRVQDRHG